MRSTDRRSQQLSLATAPVSLGPTGHAQAVTTSPEYRQTIRARGMDAARAKTGARSATATNRRQEGLSATADTRARLYAMVGPRQCGPVRYDSQAMRIALISDLHANLVALDAVLLDAERAGV